MRYLTCLPILLLFFYGCIELPQKGLPFNPQPGTDIRVPRRQARLINLFYNFDDENILIGDGFIISDTNKYMVGTFYLPTINSPYRNSILFANKNALITDFNTFKARIEKEDADDSKLWHYRIYEYKATPIRTYNSTDMYSVMYNLYYQTGGVHHTNSYLTLNYNYKTGKLINFDNYFDLKTVEDSNKFIGVIDGYLEKEPAFSIGKNGLPVDILIEQDSIVFNFYSYQIGCYAQGEPHIRIAKSELKNFIRE